MKSVQVSEHIWSLASWMLIPVHVWIVVDEGGVTLVDAGFPFMTRKILSFIDHLQAGPLQRILLTHGHSDHVGAVRGILKHHAVPVYAHRVELPYMEGERLYPRRKKPETNLPKGLAQPLAEVEDGQLAHVAGLRPFFTPGHSPGHVVYHHEQDQVLLAGDLFTSRGGKLKPPMAWFTGEMAEAVRSSAIVGQLQPKRLEICHGDAVVNPAEQLPEYLHRNAPALLRTGSAGEERGYGER